MARVGPQFAMAVTTTEPWRKEDMSSSTLWWGGSVTLSMTPPWRLTTPGHLERRSRQFHQAHAWRSV